MYTKKLGKYEKAIEDKKSDPATVRASKLMQKQMNSKLDALYADQEGQKQMGMMQDMEQVMMKWGGKMPMYDDGGLTGFENPTALQSAAMFAPTMFNLGQGMFGKVEEEKPFYNPYEQEALRDVEAGTTYNVDDQIAAAEQARGIVDKAARASGSANEYLANKMGSAFKEAQAKTGIYGDRDRYTAQAMRQLGQFKGGLGQQRAAADQQAHIAQLQNEAMKRAHLTEGLTGMSQGVQGELQRQNMMARDRQNLEMMMKVYPALRDIYGDVYKTEG